MSFKRPPATLPANRDVLVLEGEIDLAQNPSMTAEFESRLRQRSQLIVDLTAVTFIDCSALGTLLWARSRAQASGGHVALVGPCASLSRILGLTSLEAVLPLHPDVPSAEAHLRAAPANPLSD